MLIHKVAAEIVDDNLGLNLYIVLATYCRVVILEGVRVQKVQKRKQVTKFWLLDLGKKTLERWSLYLWVENKYFRYLRSRSITFIKRLVLLCFLIDLLFYTLFYYLHSPANLHISTNLLSCALNLSKLSMITLTSLDILTNFSFLYFLIFPWYLVVFCSLLLFFTLTLIHFPML